MFGGDQRRLVRFAIPIVSIASAERSSRSSWHRRTGAVGEAGHHLEVGGDGGGVDHERLVGLGDERSAGLGELCVVGTTTGAREPQQRVAVLEADAGTAFGDGGQIEVLTGLCAAPTEHAGVSGHSIEAVAQPRQARRDQLHLRPGEPVRDGATSPACTISRFGMYWASAMRQVFRCSAGTAVYAWTTAAT